MRRARLILGAVVFAGLTACAGAAPARVTDLAGDWRGRWIGASGHAVAALTVEPDGAYRMTMFLDGHDRASHGSLIAVRSGRIRYQGADGNGWLDVDGARLRFTPDGGGGGGRFDRVR